MPSGRTAHGRRLRWKTGTIDCTPSCQSGQTGHLPVCSLDHRLNVTSRPSTRSRASISKAPRRARVPGGAAARSRKSVAKIETTVPG